MSELKPCPFCKTGGLSFGNDMGRGVVQCHDCNAYIVADSEDEAITLWNTRAALPPTLSAAMELPEVRARGIYVASKAKYGPEWVALREAGYPIVSTWIDESGVGQSLDWPDLWSRCIAEASSASALVLICREGDVLKGAWCEVGAALASGKKVFAVGIEGYSIRHHPDVFQCMTENAAFTQALAAIKEPKT